MLMIGADLLDRCRSTQAMGDTAYFDLAARFGGLAPWVLRDEVLAGAARVWEGLSQPEQANWLRTPPRPPREPGVCGVLVAAHRPQAYPMLRPAFALPVKWEQARSSAAGSDLPPELAAEAARVLEVIDAFRSDGVPAARGWRLRLAVDDHPDRYDLSGWRDVGGGSWWGSLTAGWVVAARGGLPDPTVWASVGWDRGLTPVEAISSKADAAQRHGGTTLFVAATQPDLNPLVPGLEVRRLDDRYGHPLHALRPLAAALAVRPDPFEGYWARSADELEEDTRRDFFRDAQAYFSLHKLDLGNPAEATAFYRERMLPAIADRCRSLLPEGWGDRGHRLVTVVSTNPELVELAARIVRPSRMLVLFTPTTERQWAGVIGRVAEVVPEDRLQAIPVPDDLRPGGLPPAVLAFARDGSPEELVVDLTPGTKLMTLTLDRDLTNPKCVRFYLKTEWTGPSMRFGTEQVILLDTKQ